MPRAANKIAGFMLIGMGLVIGFAGVAVPSAYSTVVNAPVALADETRTIDAARDVCVSVNATRRVSDCKIVRWTRTVNFSLDTTATEAAKVCAGAAGEAARSGEFSRQGWTIRIYSHYAIAPIATCHLN